MVKYLDNFEVLQTLCKLKKKWGMFISFSDWDTQESPIIDIFEIIKAAPYLKCDEAGQIIVDKHGILLFDTQKEMDEYYYNTIGDDGPRKGYKNRYNGPARIYAITCNPKGVLMNENT